MKINCKGAAVCAFLSVPILVFLAAAPCYAKWKVKQETVGEGVPSWMAIIASNDGQLWFWVEYPTDGYCIPVVVVKSNNSSAFDPELVTKPTILGAVLRFSQDKLLHLPGYAASGSIFIMEVDRENYAALNAEFAAKKQFLVSLPGKEGEVSGTFGLEGARPALQKACAACEDEFFATTDFVFPDSQERLLKKEGIGFLSKRMLRIARNEIYARQGFVFKDPYLNEFFKKKKWYQPAGGEIRLSEIEKANAALLASWE